MTDDLNRRMLLSAAGLIGVAAVASKSKAGPIDPPVGPVAPTGRTLDEVYNKVPGANGTGDGRIPLAGGTNNLFISAPGSYILTGNIDTATTCITIIASKVTLDLNGYHLTNSATTGTAVITLSGSLSGITIRNGSLSGGVSGIFGISTLSSILLEDLRISRAKQSGIALTDGGNRGFILRRCQIVETGLLTVPADGALAVTAINLAGDAHRLEDCTVARIFNSGTGGTIRGIVIAGSGATSGTLVDRCFLTHDVGVNGTGLQMTPGGTYRNNIAQIFTTPYSVLNNTDGGGNL